jgi:hypothetical protein
LQDQPEPDICLFSLEVAGGALAAALERLGGAVVARTGSEALVELPFASTADELAREIERSDGKLTSVVSVGGIAEPIEIFTGDEP